MVVSLCPAIVGMPFASVAAVIARTLARSLAMFECIHVHVMLVHVVEILMRRSWSVCVDVLPFLSCVTVIGELDLYCSTTLCFTPSLVCSPWVTLSPSLIVTILCCCQGLQSICGVPVVGGSHLIVGVLVSVASVLSHAISFVSVQLCFERVASHVYGFDM